MRKTIDKVGCDIKPKVYVQTLYIAIVQHKQHGVDKGNPNGFHSTVSDLIDFSFI